MQNVSPEFKTAIKAPARILKIRAEIQAPDLTVYTLTAEDLAQGGFYYKAACMEHDFALGGATAASCTLTLTNRDKQWDDIDLEGGKLTVFCGVVTGCEEPEVPEDPEEEMPDPVPIIEDVLMGTFIIDRQGRPYATITLTATDRLVLLDKPLATVSGIVYPITARALLAAVSGACNVPLDNSLLDIEELDEIDLHQPEYDGVTCRDALSEIALLCGGFARCTREGAIEIVKLVQPESESAYVTTKHERFDFRETTETITLTGLKYGDVIIGEEGYILEVDRMYMMPDALALSHLQALWADFDGFTYTPCTAQYKGNPAIDTGDAILHITRNGEEVLTFVGRHTYTFGGRCTVDSYGKSKSEQKYISANTRRISGLVAGITHDFDKKLSSFEQASAQMSDLIGLMMGVYPTQEPQQDGSVIYYWHDQPLLEESLIIWRLDANVFAVSDDGGETWTGQTADGTVIARTVHALQIHAQQVILSDGTTSVETAIDEIELTPGPPGKDGEDAITVHIDSINGYIFKNTAVATTLVVTIIKGDQWIDNSTKLEAEFGASAYLQWSEKKFGELTYEDISLVDERLSDNGFLFTISAADIMTKSTFRCDLRI
ncbi:MAG: hypothetical protein WC145_12125 [Aliarcobacter sp.]